MGVADNANATCEIYEVKHIIVIYAFFRHKKDRATVAPLLGLVVIYKIA